MIRPSNYSRGLHVSTVLTSQQTHYLRDIINESSCADLDTLCTRIGSVSENALVYKCFIESIPVAVKIDNAGYMNIPEEHSLEYDFSTFLSENYPQHFIRMLAHKYCPFEYDAQIIYKSVIYMELVAGDLWQIIADGTTSQILNKYVEDVFLANIALAYSGYVHGDMHLGNVFVRDNGAGNTAILGDFGKFKEALFNTSQLEDMTKFFTSLKAATENIPYLHKIQQKVKTYYMMLANKLENYPIELAPEEVLKNALQDWQSISL